MAERQDSFSGWRKLAFKSMTKEGLAQILHQLSSFVDWCLNFQGESRFFAIWNTSAKANFSEHIQINKYLCPTQANINKNILLVHGLVSAM